MNGTVRYEWRWGVCVMGIRQVGVAYGACLLVQAWGTCMSIQTHAGQTV